MTRKQDSAKKTNWKELMSEQEDFLRPLIREILQEVLETEMDEALGAEKGERTANRARLPFRILWPDAGGDQQETPLSVASIKRYRPATCVTCGSEGVL